MARSKVVNCSIIRDSEMMSFPDRVFKLYLCLYLECEDDGLICITPEWLRLNAYAGKRIPEKQVNADLALLEGGRWIKLYTVQGKMYVALVRIWQDHNSRYPLVAESVPFPPAEVISEYPDFAKYSTGVRAERRETKLTRRMRQQAAFEFPKIKS